MWKALLAINEYWPFPHKSVFVEQLQVSQFEITRKADIKVSHYFRKEKEKED